MVTAADSCSSSAVHDAAALLHPLDAGSARNAAAGVEARQIVHQRRHLPLGRALEERRPAVRAGRDGAACCPCVPGDSVGKPRIAGETVSPRAGKMPSDLVSFAAV